MTSPEFRSVTKLLTKVFRTGSKTSGGTNSCDACAINCNIFVTSEKEKCFSKFQVFLSIIFSNN